ncbi:LpxI family protein [Tropicimonas marinistellae]|uniref:LpxI family protein n=1 Tax=Tropicimonas marinistellae TaxID=1739787 RepID=UPI0008320E28|nr:UDP-2,3-diacylglucosamine diphosphatase LpxI [Tropicimonas marinistellae]
MGGATDTPPLALIAGRGRLPELLAERLRASGRDVIYCAYHDAPPGTVAPDLAFRLETLGTLLKQLQKRGARDVCFAGGVRRPKLEPRALDLATAPLVPRLMAALGKGDDGALRVVLELFEARGMAVRGAHELLPDLLPAPGVLGRFQPEEADRKDAERGAEIVVALGSADVGQACVVSRRQALSVEAMPGTDWMLETLATNRAGLPEGGLLYKGPKPRQDRRVDLPAIGQGTIRNAARAGLRGVVIEAGGVMVLDREEVVREADAAGLFLWVRPREAV